MTAFAVQILWAGVIAALVVFVIAWLVQDKLLGAKEAFDEKKYKAAKAGGVAQEMGFKVFDELLFWFAAGNIKNTWKILDKFFNDYCQDPRGPARFARDVFMHTWAKLRVDKEYANEVRAEVLSDALGVPIDNKTDIVAAKAGERAQAIGWSHVAKMANQWAERDFIGFTATVKGLFDAFMDTDGETKIAMSVARPTFAALWGSKVDGAHAVVQSLVEEKAKELGWTPPAAAAAPPSTPAPPAAGKAA